MASAADKGLPVMLEYVVIDKTRRGFLTRTYVLDADPQTPAECPPQACNLTLLSPDIDYPSPEIVLRPVAIFNDPFRRGLHKIVLCVPEYVDQPDADCNTRTSCLRALTTVVEHQPWYGYEQEYFIVDKHGRPADWDHFTPDKRWYMMVGRGDHGHEERELAETHARACIYAGIKIAGYNRESYPSQWEFQVGPVGGIHAADQLVVARYILQRLAENNNMHVAFNNPESIRDTGAFMPLHLNFSTKDTRADGGIEYIHKYVENMKNRPQETVLKYYDLNDGADMKWILNGERYMATYGTFTCKVGDKDECSVRIPAFVARQGKGYIEERRPISDADPYNVCKALTMAALTEANGNDGQHIF